MTIRFAYGSKQTAEITGVYNKEESDVLECYVLYTTRTKYYIPIEGVYCVSQELLRPSSFPEPTEKKMRDVEVI